MLSEEKKQLKLKYVAAGIRTLDLWVRIPGSYPTTPRSWRSRGFVTIILHKIGSHVQTEALKIVLSHIGHLMNHTNSLEKNQVAILFC